MNNSTTQSNRYAGNPYAFQAVKILNFYDETPIDRTYELEWADSVPLGGFFEVSVPGVGEAPISISEHKDGVLFMTIRRVGKVTDVIFNKKMGEHLYLRGPYGNGFTENFIPKGPVTVIAGGTGLAPVRGLVDKLSLERPSELELLVGFKSPGDLLFEETLKTWESRFRAIVTVDHGAEGWSGNTGLVTKYIPSLTLSDVAVRTFVVVGPPIMMKFVTLELLKNGVSEDNIVVSFERNMSCGIGKCGHCKIDETYVCLEGPVFGFAKAKHLID